MLKLSDANRRKLKQAFWVIFFITMSIYTSMLVWSLPAISSAAGGLTPFDMRPGGYTFAEAQTFLAALPADSISFYHDVQVGLLDMAYPGLLALMLFLAIALLTPARFGVWNWILALIAIPGSVFDYMENALIQQMLTLGSANITPEIVASASANSQLKAAFSTIAMSLLLILLAVWAWGVWRSRKAA